MANEYSADIPKGLNVPKQVRLDSITGIQNEAILKNLGPGNNLAFKYYEGLEVYCKDEKTTYRWREVIGSEVGLLNTHFIYPTYNPVDGIDYSGKSFNFFEVTNSNIQPPDGTETKLVSGTNTTVVGNGSTATPYSVNVTLDGSETKVIAGANTTVTGLGTTISPYVINSTDTIADGSETKITAGTNITVSGSGTTATPYIINSTASGGGNQGIQDVIQTDPVINTEASILLSQGSSLSVKGETQGGYEERSPWLKLDSFVTLANPYDNNATVEIGISNEANDELFKGFRIDENSDIEIVASYFNQGLVYSTNTIYNKYFNENTVIPRWYLSQQKEIVASTNLSIYDHDNTIYVGNGANDITITVDSIHGVSNFEAGFIQTGTGTVTFVPGSGVTLLSPTGYKIKGQNYQAFLIRKGNTNTYNLLGNVVA